MPEPVCVTVTFSHTVKIAGFKIWNYNKSAEDTSRGAKSMRVSIDGVNVSPAQGYAIRKVFTSKLMQFPLIFQQAPGHARYDFGQTILLFSKEALSSAEKQVSIPLTNLDPSKYAT